jgi:alkylhydroperoxidase family enzyme
LTQAVLDDWRTAPIGEGLRAMLGFIETMTLRPDELGPEDADAVRAAGVSDQAMIDAVHAAAAFNIIDRIADAADFKVVSRESFLRGARMLLKRGYA